MALVSSVNKMYVYFLSGWWLMSSLQNASPSGITGNAAIYDLAADGTPTTVTLSSSDPEGFPIVWSHSVISGSLGGTTVTNVNNVFTITPSTDAADAGTFTLRFAASDGQGGESGSQSQFTLDFVFIVTNSRYTTLLATATGTSDNNNITDASSNNHTITVNGDAHAGTFSPYRSGGYSTYFDGSGDYLSISSNASLNFDYGAFTIEFWVQSSVKTNFQTVVAKYDSSDTTGFFILLDSSGNLLFGANPSSYITSSGTDICDGAWHHISCTRSVSSGVGTMTIYIDGSSAGTLNRLDNVYNVVDFEIGRQNAVNRPLIGYVSDLRVVKGVAITPPSGGPTERLEAVTNTSLLTCHLPYIADGSTNDHSITVNGNVSIEPFSPYDYNEYDAADHGGSVYFDGTTDYLLINSPPTLGANDWTFETWYYASNPLTYNNLLSQGPGNNTVVSNFSVSTTGEIWIQTYTTTNVILYNTAAGIINGGVWNHIVLTHEYDGSSGGTYKIYVNGNQVGSNVSYTSGYYWNSGGIAGTALAMAQYRYNTQANGECYFSDWKISNSVTYTSNFTPPTEPISSTNSLLHIKGTDASVIDKSQGSNLKLVGNTTGSTTQVKFAGSKSMYFDGTGDEINAGRSIIPIGFSDFTVEGWVNFSNVSGQQFICIQAPNGTTTATTFMIYLANSKIYNQWGSGSAYIDTDILSANTWYHFASVHDSANSLVYFYLDGSSVGSFSSGLRSIGDYVFDIGARDSALFLNGYLQDLRVSNYARYTANFTPPTASLEG
jgi:hypothetical protein